jgi:flagellar motility protein MotE (MotC chaperone)
MKSLYNLLALVAIASLLIISGLIGYLVANGRLNSHAAEQIAKILRGESLVAAATTQPTTMAATQPATQPATSNSTFQSIELQLAQIERERKEIDDRYARLKDAEMKLIMDRETMLRQKKEFDQQVQSQQKTSEDEGFAKALTLYTQMPPKMAKEDFMKLDTGIVVRYLMNMKKQESAKILKEFKTPAEQQKRQEILEEIRTQKVLVNETTDKNEG